MPRLTGKEIALIFEKSSTRTRCAFEVAAFDQGAHVTYLDPTGSQMGHKESIADTARVLGRMFDAIEYRGVGPGERRGARPPRRRARSTTGSPNEWHPTQMLADFLTMHERSHKPYDEHRLRVRRRRPLQHGPLAAGHRRDHGLRRAPRHARRAAPARRRRRRSRASWPPTSGAQITITDDVAAGVAGADFVHTDVWVSMGEPKEVWAERARAAAPLPGQRRAARGDRQPEGQVHALPARVPRRETTVGGEIAEATGMHDGLEVTDEVFQSPASIVFDQAENRLHTIKAVLVATLG